MKWAITTKFSYYLYGNKCEVFSDHNPLLYLMSTAKLDAMGHRWLADLCRYEFTCHYKPGVLNIDADLLSRRPYPDREQVECTRTVSPELFKELCSLLTDPHFAGLAEITGVLPTAVSQAVCVDSVRKVDWPVEQRKDGELNRVTSIVEKGQKLTNRQRRKESRGVMRLLSYWSQLRMIDNVLYRVSTAVTGEEVFRVIVPRHLQQEVLSITHENCGHLGRDKTLSLAEDRYFWVGLSDSIDRFVKTCMRCVCAKSPHLPQRAPLVNIVTTRPLELVCMDFLTLEESKGKYCNLLVITDHYSRYSIAVATRNQHAKTVAKALVDNFIVHYGLMERLHSDKGQCFVGK